MNTEPLKLSTEDTVRIIEWIRARDGRVTLSEFVKGGPRPYRGRILARQVLDRLVSRRYGVWKTLRHPGAGRWAKVFILTGPKIITKEGV